MPKPEFLNAAELEAAVGQAVKNPKNKLPAPESAAIPRVGPPPAPGKIEATRPPKLGLITSAQQPKVVGEFEAIPLKTEKGKPEIEPTVIVEEAVTPEEERREMEKKMALEDLESAVKKLARLEEEQARAKTLLSKGKLKKILATPEGAVAYQELARLAPEDLIAIDTRLTEAQKAELRAAKSDIQLVQEQLEEAKKKALALGMSESEIAKLLPAPEEEARMEPAVDGAAERPKEPEKLKKWLGLRMVGRMAFETVASVLAVNAPRVTEQYVKEKKERGKVTEEVIEIMKALETSITPEMRAALQEGAGFIPVAEEKIKELRERVDTLVKEGKIAENRRDQILGEFAMITLKAAKESEPAQSALIKDSTKVLNDYLEKKISKLKVANEWISTGLVATQQYMARGIAMLGLATVDTMLKQKREYELDLRAKFLREGVEIKPGFLEKLWGVGAKRVIAGSVKEYGRQWAGRPMEKVKALLTTARWAAVGSAAYSEYADQTISNSVNYFIEQWKEKGPRVLLEGFTRNVERIFHLTPQGERGQETLKPVHQEEAVAPEAKAEARIAIVTREQEGMKFLDENGVLKSLVDQGRAEFTIAPDGHKELILNLDESKGGFGEVQQGLRRLFGQYITLEGNKFRDTDADRLEKMVKLATHLLRGEKIPTHLLDKGFEIPANFSEIVHYGASGNVEIDMERFQNEIAPTLEKLADHYRVSMMAYIDNTSHRIWQQEIMDARAAASGAHIEVDNFDKSPAVRAHEKELFNAEAKALAGGEAHDVQVGLHEGSGSFKTTVAGAEINVKIYQGRIVSIINTETNEAVIDPLGDVNAFEDPLAQAKLQEAVETEMWRTAEQMETARGAKEIAAAAAPEAPPEIAGLNDARDFIRPVSEGGFKGTDGKLHFGTFTMKVGWLESWDDMFVQDFVKEAPGRFSPARLFSAENEARYKLAHAMETHGADLKTSVGKWMVENVKKLPEWLR